MPAAGLGGGRRKHARPAGWHTARRDDGGKGGAGGRPGDHGGMSAETRDGGGEEGCDAGSAYWPRS